MYSASQREICQYDDRVCLEVGAKLLSHHMESSVACPRWVCWVSTSNRDLLMKNIGLCFRFSFSLNKVSLTEASNTAR